MEIIRPFQVGLRAQFDRNLDLDGIEWYCVSSRVFTPAFPRGPKNSVFCEPKCFVRAETFAIDNTDQLRMWIQYEVDRTTLSALPSPKTPIFRILQLNMFLNVSNFRLLPRSKNADFCKQKWSDRPETFPIDSIHL